MEKVAIIGAGFTGLSAAYKLAKSGYDVTVFEKEDKPGGLASGFKEKNWQWSLDRHYHHIFTSDKEILVLANEIGHEIIFSCPTTSILYSNEVSKIDSPLDLLKFKHLSFLDRLKTGFTLFYLKYVASWRPLEKFTAQELLEVYAGKKSWKILWEPLFKSKFGKFSSQIPASWFWARIKKRSAKLAYPVGGFQSLAGKLSTLIKESGGKLCFGEDVKRIEKTGKKIRLETSKSKYKFDKVICTAPSAVLAKITRGFPKNYYGQLTSLQSIGAINLILRLKNKLLPKGEYWLNVNDTSFPFVALVEHTNFIDRKYFGNDKLVYLGSYLPHNHSNFEKSAKELFKTYRPFIKKINPQFSKFWVKSMYLFKDKFAQPIIPLNYSEKMLPLKTPIEGLFLASMQQVYPWDRGVNYAVQLGEAVAEQVIGDL